MTGFKSRPRNTWIIWEEDQTEMESNPDEEWNPNVMSYCFVLRNQGWQLATTLTERHKSIFTKVQAVLIKGKYEKDS